MKPFCIYFPQFYPTQINNQTWGHGFTDWVLVAYANMHNIWRRRAPKIGFYDGSNKNIHLTQINQMKGFGLGGIALYHYWFYDRRELTSFEETVKSNDNPDYPWFLIWATESWSKRWLGDQTEIITFTEKPTLIDIEKHCIYLSECFNNPTYHRVDNRPLFIFFNLSHFSDPTTVIANYRTAFKKLGQNPMIGQFVKNPFDKAYAQLVDINYLFEPRLFFGFNNTTRTPFAKKLFDQFRNLFGKHLAHKLLVISDIIKKKSKTFSAIEYIDYLNNIKRKKFLESFESPFQEVVSPGWNNIPRHGERFTALEDIQAGDFYSILKNASNTNKKFPVLINAWNEWSEGAAIEPCEYYGTIYADQIKSIIID